MAGLVDDFDPSPARTKLEPLDRLLAPPPSNSSKYSAYTRAALSSSSFFFKSAASFSFSRRFFFVVPWTKWDNFWLSTAFCYFACMVSDKRKGQVKLYPSHWERRLIVIAKKSGELEFSFVHCGESQKYTTCDLPSSMKYIYYIIIKLERPPEAYAMGFIGGWGLASNLVYICVPAESIRI